MNERDTCAHSYSKATNLIQERSGDPATLSDFITIKPFVIDYSSTGETNEFAGVKVCKLQAFLNLNKKACFQSFWLKYMNTWGLYPVTYEKFIKNPKYDQFNRALVVLQSAQIEAWGTYDENRNNEIIRWTYRVDDNNNISGLSISGTWAYKFGLGDVPSVNNYRNLLLNLKWICQMGNLEDKVFLKEMQRLFEFGNEADP